ncbi:MAG: DUF4386 domain-containing protein [Thermoanaerobaculia bacterium]
MNERRVEASPQVLARIGGLLYLVIIAIGLFDEAYVRGKVVVAGDAAATAANLRSLEPLWRFGIAAELFLLICAIAMGWIFWLLLRPVSRDLAVLAIFFDVISMAVEAAITLYLVEAVLPLGKAEYLKALAPEQLNALSRLAISAHGYGFGVALIFFACFCLVAGHLIVKSGYFPKTIGVLLQIAGVCYLVNSFALLLSPDLAGRLFPVILIPSFIGESSLCLWLIVKGVNVEKWNRRQAEGRLEGAVAAV